MRIHLQHHRMISVLLDLSMMLNTAFSVSLSEFEVFVWLKVAVISSIIVSRIALPLLLSFLSLSLPSSIHCFSTPLRSHVNSFTFTF